MIKNPFENENHWLYALFFSTLANISPTLMAKAQKHCKHATSALQYDDVKTAIQNLEECLKILKTGKE